MNSKHILQATIYSSMLVLGMSGSAIAQNNAASQDSASSTGAQGGAPTQQDGKTAQQGGTATKQGSKTAQQSGTATEQGGKTAKQGGTGTKQGGATDGTDMAQGDGAAQDKAAPTMDSGLVGMEVRNGQNKVIGDVANVLVAEDGRIDAIILGTGGVLGIGESQYVVPWDRVQVSVGQGYVTVDAPADQLNAEFSAFEPKPAPAPAATTGGTGTGTGGTGTGMGGQSPTQQMQQGSGGGSGTY